jgi:hypothetical protein
MEHKDHRQIEKGLEEAKKLVKVGGIYSHYKNSDKLYEVIAIGVQEATDKLCVIYQAKYNEKLIFARDLDSWLKEPSKGTSRFNLIR